MKLTMNLAQLGCSEIKKRDVRMAKKAPKFTEGKQNRLSQVKQRHQFEADSVGGKPVLRGLQAD